MEFYCLPIYTAKVSQERLHPPLTLTCDKEQKILFLFSFMGAINQNIYLAGYSPWGRRESETTERLSLCTHTHKYVPLELQLKTICDLFFP